MKTDTKHTPGPWGFHLDDDSTKVSAYFTAKNCNSQFLTETPETTYCSADTDRVIANAQLIAAAPELLEALQDSYQILLSRGKELGLDDKGPVLDKVRAAIKKAIK